MQNSPSKTPKINHPDPATPKSGAPLIDDQSPPPVIENTDAEPADLIIDEAVDDIDAQESDELLASQDAELEKAFERPKNGWLEKLKKFAKDWWDNPKKRWASVAVVSFILLVICIIPMSRYFVLNAVGVRSGASLTVLDNTTQLPLKNVSVRVSGQSALSNSDGKVELKNLKLGKTDLVIQKRAFASFTKKITVGLGSNPLDKVVMKAVGSQYTFVAHDFLSAKPIQKAEVSFNEATALSNQDGKMFLTIDTSDMGESQNIAVTLKADSYRDETITLNLNSKDTPTINMVPARKEVYISKRSGKYDLYKSELDGKNEQLVLAGTGSERDDMTLVSHPSNELIAFVSTRDNIRNKDGYLLSTLNIINLKDDSKFTISQSEKIQIVGWEANKLIYVQVAAGASAVDPRRQRLISYDSFSASRLELASSNYFNDVTMAQGTIYYAPSSAFQTDQNAKLYKVDLDGSNKKTIIDQEVYNIFRNDYGTLHLSTDKDWYEHKIGTSEVRKLNGAPANLVNHVYVDSLDKKHSLWVDQRDGKGVVLSYDTDSRTDKVLNTRSGLNYPIRWINDSTAVFRVKTEQETADYAISINGGKERKIRDVTNTSGLSKWYYY